MNKTSNLKQQIEKYIPYNEQEETDKRQMLEFIESNEFILTATLNFTYGVTFNL